VRIAQGVIAWLLIRRAVDAGELSAVQAREPSRRLGHASDSDEPSLADMPPRARALIDASCDLYQRVARFDAELDSDSRPSPARSLLDRLEAAF
jgi:regulator of CtrA degradation